MDSEKILSRLVQIGTVSDVDSGKRMARVILKETGHTSGWLKVLQPGTWWMPKVNDQVLVLYLPVFNSDGFILGGI